MLAVVLGAAAGGGFPQWNSRAPACGAARAGQGAAKPRTQASLAVSGDGQSWFLLNASPDLRQQIEANSVLHPRGAIRSSPIAGVVLANGDVDAIAGLLVLREGHRFTVHATGQVLAILDENPIFQVLARDKVRRAGLGLEAPTTLLTPDGADAGLAVTLFAVPGKVPLYAEENSTAPAIVADGRTVGVEIGDGSRRLLFIPACAAMTPDLARRLQGADLVCFDATLWDDQEMIRMGVGEKTGRRMGHMSLSGNDGTLAAFHTIAVRRKVLIHINNTNPILLENSPERAAVVAQGWDVAEDGMRFVL